MWNNGLDEEDLQHEGGGRELEGNWEYFVFLCRYIYIYIEGDQDDPYTLENPPSFGLQDGREPFRSHNACKQVKIKF